MMSPEKTFLFIAALLFMQSTGAAELQGTVGWARISPLGFTVTGVVDLVAVQPGAKVSKGQLLVQLEQRPFTIDVKKYRANTETIEPLLFDSKIELSQAEELYDRTVLSQVELQKIEARHRGLEAQSRVAQMEFELAKWRLEKSSLLAPFDGIVVSNAFSSGQIVSEENKADISLLLASSSFMSLTVAVSAEELAALPINHSVKIQLGSDSMPGVVRQHDMQANDKGLLRCVIEFENPQGRTYYAGQTAKVIY